MRELLEYVDRPDEPSVLMDLARWYETSGHLSPACGFYLRAAEFSGDSDISFECMLRIHHCLSQLGGRDYTCENVAKMALALRPRAPEPWFLLSQIYERKSKWMDSYIYASLGLEFSDGRPSALRFGSTYEHEYMLVYQKAVSAWWYGRPDESRRLLNIMLDEYGTTMNMVYAGLVQSAVSRFGSGVGDNRSL